MKKRMTSIVLLLAFVRFVDRGWIAFTLRKQHETQDRLLMRTDAIERRLEKAGIPREATRDE